MVGKLILVRHLTGVVGERKGENYRELSEAKGKPMFEGSVKQA